MTTNSLPLHLLQQSLSLTMPVGKASHGDSVDLSCLCGVSHVTFEAFSVRVYAMPLGTWVHAGGR